ncbi:MAG: hydroxylamine reductase [Candidatus Delongbacteria bacterium]|nr:hydroxylamine reductase [Candidatus Delongbacteria bacterium]
MSMFCYQCQETARGTGCTVRGVCGKTEDVANIQDLALYLLKGLSFYALKGKEMSIGTVRADHLMFNILFATITNANFDRKWFMGQIRDLMTIRNELKKQIESAGGRLENLPDAALWHGIQENEMEEKARQVGVLATPDEDIRSLRQILMYGLKGIAAYIEHACNLGFENPDIYLFMHRALVATLNDSLGANDLIGWVMECGKYGVEAMALLDKANTTTYGNPEITRVKTGVGKNPGILISGHDLKDLEELLQQTEGKGIDIYTHSEMLPANSYPGLKKYPHLVGNYGNAWWKQDKEFESFNGPVLLTSNCLIPPKDSYKDRVYMTGAVGYEGLKTIPARPEGGHKDFSVIIEHAKRCPAPVELENGEIIGGFAHATVLGLADKVISAVKSGAIKRFMVMAGCDGRMKSREYYTEFAQNLPADTVILTAGCAKYRYNKLPLGDIQGIPRVLDAGQCNDSYSLAIIALKLKEAFGLDDVNQLPISFNIAWYEQKAVLVLLALLYLGFKKIHLGPTLPGFLTPNTAKVLVDNFGIGGIATVDEDLKFFFPEA